MNQHSTAAEFLGEAIGRRPPEARPVPRSGLFVAVAGCGIAGLAGLLAAFVALHATALPVVAEAVTTDTTRTIAYHPQAVAKGSRLRVASAPEPIPTQRVAPAKVHRLPELARVAAKPVIAPFLMSAPSDVDQLPAFSAPAPSAESASQFAQLVIAEPEPVVMASLEPAAPVAEVLASVPGAAQPEEPALEASLPIEAERPQTAAAALLQAIDNVPLPLARPIRPVKNPLTAVPARTRALPTANVLAYARPDAGNEEEDDVLDARPGPAPSLGRGVAIYDISAATVYMPNGEKLEAHSGLGKMKDDPSQAHQRMRGPTPPHTYSLAMRESLFHGVEAIRLHPVGGQKMIHNRDGLLAHTYMLGKGGDSNGCVSFKDYRRFLAAFKRGEVKSLVVVASMPRTSRIARPKSLLSSLFKSNG